MVHEQQLTDMIWAGGVTTGKGYFMLHKRTWDSVFWIWQQEENTINLALS